MSPSIAMTVMPAMKCSYRSKPCHAVRATKMNGEFHKLCEFHRRRANLNQQRVHQRRKLREYGQKQQQQQQQQQQQNVHPLRCVIPSPSESSLSSPLAWGLASPTSADKFYDGDILSDIELEFDFDFECEPSTSPCGDLPLPDLEILELLLSDSTASAAAMDAKPASRFEFLELDFSEV